LNEKPEPPKQPSAVIIPFPRIRMKRVPDRTVVFVPDDKLEAYLALLKDPKGAA
jgi:hypothetical protein